MARTTLLDALQGRRTAVKTRSRIYERNGDGTATQTDYVRNRLNGMVEERSVVGKRRTLPESVVVKDGCECIDKGSVVVDSKIVNSSQMATNRYSSAVPVIPAETTGRRVAQSVPQKAEATGSIMGQWTITLANTTNATQQTVIGDAVGLIGDKKGVGQLPAGVTVDGTFGATTLAKIKDITASVPVALASIHVEADDASFYGNGQIANVVADVENQAPSEKRVYFKKMNKATNFNDKVREDESYYFQIMGLSGIYVSIPAGRTVSLSFDVVGVGETFLINPAR